MNDDLDTLLGQLATSPVPAALDKLPAMVMARLHADAASARMGMRVAVSAAFGALLFGVGGSIAFPAQAPGAPPAPFGVSADLVPSTLLDGGR